MRDMTYADIRLLGKRVHELSYTLSKPGDEVDRQRVLSHLLMTLKNFLDSTLNDREQASKIEYLDWVARNFQESAHGNGRRIPQRRHTNTEISLPSGDYDSGCASDTVSRLGVRDEDVQGAAVGG